MPRHTHMNPIVYTHRVYTRYEEVPDAHVQVINQRKSIVAQRMNKLMETGRISL